MQKLQQEALCRSPYSPDIAHTDYPFPSNIHHVLIGRFQYNIEIAFRDFPYDKLQQ